MGLGFSVSSSTLGFSGLGLGFSGIGVSRVLGFGFGLKGFGYRDGSASRGSAGWWSAAAARERKGREGGFGQGLGSAAAKEEGERVSASSGQGKEREKGGCRVVGRAWGRRQ